MPDSLFNYYSIETKKELIAFYKAYIPLVLHQLIIFNIDINEFGIHGDHLGLQVLSAKEFDQVGVLLLDYCELNRNRI